MKAQKFGIGAIQKFVNRSSKKRGKEIKYVLNWNDEYLGMRIVCGPMNEEAARQAMGEEVRKRLVELCVVEDAKEAEEIYLYAEKHLNAECLPEEDECHELHVSPDGASIIYGSDYEDRYQIVDYVICEIGKANLDYDAKTHLKYKNAEPMNTTISYLYRDACNYKQYNQVVIPGTFSKAQIETIMGCLDSGEYFIPAQVGFPEVRFGEITEDDHCWFELQETGFTATSEEADTGMTPDEVTASFLAAKGSWDDTWFDKLLDNALEDREGE